MLDLLRYELNEINAANLKIEEEKELEEQSKIMQNSEKLQNSLNIKLRFSLNGLFGICDISRQTIFFVRFLPKCHNISIDV